MGVGKAGLASFSPRVVLGSTPFANIEVIFILAN
jgi:hypothetical protein